MYFVMLNTAAGLPAPMLDNDGMIAMFDYYEDGEEAAEASDLGRAHGYEVYEWGY